MKNIEIINIVEQYNRLKSKFNKDNKILLNIQIEDSAFEMSNSDEAKQQIEVVKADQEALKQFLMSDIINTPIVIPEYINRDVEAVGKRLNQEI